MEDDELTEYLTPDQAHVLTKNLTDEKLSNWVEAQWDYVVEATSHLDADSSRDAADLAWEMSGRWTAIAILHEEKARRDKK